MCKAIFTQEIAKKLGEEFGLTWDKFDAAQLADGMNVELEHGTTDSSTNVTGDDEITTMKIALAHLNEFPDYYTRLAIMEEEAEAFWDKKD